jgi:hypothetical protein
MGSAFVLEEPCFFAAMFSGATRARSGVPVKKAFVVAARATRQTAARAMASNGADPFAEVVPAQASDTKATFMLKVIKNL